ncbi:MAG: hypothetical protein U0798_00685 [Gemmataceae bacterium]
MRCHSGFAVAFALFFAPLANAQTFTVTVVAVDANKKPVAKAEAALFWTAQEGKMVPGNETPQVTDANGKVKLTIPDWKEKRPILVLSDDRTLGGWAGASKEDDGKELTVTLGPLVKVKGKLESKDLGVAPKWANTMVTRKGFRAYNVQFMTKEASFEFLLPVGEYTLISYGQDVNQLKTPLTVTTDRSEIDLGKLDLKATALAKLIGKPMADWSITDARGVKKDIHLADYKGKWVYIEFWGFW